MKKMDHLGKLIDRGIRAMSMEYNRAFAGCPKCWHEERGEQVTNELVWGFAFSRGNVAFCPECGYEVAQNDLPDICFSPDRESINIDAFNMWLTTQAGEPVELAYCPIHNHEYDPVSDCGCSHCFLGIHPHK